MLNYKINLGGWNGVFAVPNDVVDKYIKIASGVSVKVLLFFLRYSGGTVTSEYISDSLNVSVEDVNDALLFWEQIGLFTKNDSQYVPAEVSALQNSDSIADTEPTQSEVKHAVAKTAALRTPYFPPKDIAEIIKGDDKINYLFKTCESLYGRPLKNTEQNVLVTIVEYIGLPAEVTMMLVHYCVSINKNTAQFMKNLAMDWYEKGITDVATAEGHINSLYSRNSAEGIIKRIFGYTRNLTQKEQDFSDKWINQWSFTSEIIRLAYDINANANGNPTFPYMNKILEDWYTKGLTTKEQILNERAKIKPLKSDNTSSINTDEIDELILSDYI